jgi:hypothetical protein
LEDMVVEKKGGLSRNDGIDAQAHDEQRVCHLEGLLSAVSLPFRLTLLQKRATRSRYRSGRSSTVATASVPRAVTLGCKRSTDATARW